MLIPLCFFDVFKAAPAVESSSLVTLLVPGTDNLVMVMP